MALAHKWRYFCPGLSSQATHNTCPSSFFICANMFWDKFLKMSGLGGITSTFCPPVLPIRAIPDIRLSNRLTSQSGWKRNSVRAESWVDFCPLCHSDAWCDLVIFTIRWLFVQCKANRPFLYRMKAAIATFIYRRKDLCGCWLLVASSRHLGQDHECSSLSANTGVVGFLLLNGQGFVSSSRLIWKKKKMTCSQCDPR